MADFIEENKACIKCGIEKDIDGFELRLDTGKRRNVCRKCVTEYFKNRYNTNKKEIASKKHENYLKNPEKTKERTKRWKLNNPDKVIANRLKNREKANEKQQIKYKNDPKIRERNKQYKKDNPDKVREWRRKDKQKLTVRISDNLRSRLRQAVKNGFKSGSAVRDLGCSIEEFKKYLESKFYKNPDTNEMMNWDNYGKYGWHIDHITPLANFDLTDKEQFLKACHYTNLQPLWAKENLKKGSKTI